MTTTARKQRCKQKTLKVAQEETAVAIPLTDDEKKRVDVFRQKVERAKNLPLVKNNSLEMAGHENDKERGQMLAQSAIMEICKTDHSNAALKVVQDITAVRSIDNPDDCLNTALQQIAAIEPQSYLESMLVGQMLQVNTAITKCMGMAFMKDQTAYGKELNANLATKLQRTFVAQIEALQKLRGKGGQKVTVEHVHVYQGGQAIVGNIDKVPRGGEG